MPQADTEVFSTKQPVRPPFSVVPELKIDLIAAPTSDLTKLMVTSGVGLTSDFNVHLIGKTGLLEVGTYVVKYTAKAVE